LTTSRHLSAILAADVAGYSRLMGADEEKTLERLDAADVTHEGRGISFRLILRAARPIKLASLISESIKLNTWSHVLFSHQQATYPGMAIKTPPRSFRLRVAEVIVAMGFRPGTFR
jgi:hypothetical protein